MMQETAPQEAPTERSFDSQLLKLLEDFKASASRSLEPQIGQKKSLPSLQLLDVWTVLDRCDDFPTFETELGFLVDAHLQQLCAVSAADLPARPDSKEASADSKTSLAAALDSHKTDLLQGLCGLAASFLQRDSTVAASITSSLASKQQLEFRTFTSVESVLGEEIRFGSTDKKRFVSTGQLSLYRKANLTMQLQIKELTGHKIFCLSQFYQRGYLCCVKMPGAKPDMTRLQEETFPTDLFRGRQYRYGEPSTGVFNQHKNFFSGLREPNFTSKDASNWSYSIGELDLETMEFHRLFPVDHKVSSIQVIGDTFMLLDKQTEQVTFVSSSGQVCGRLDSLGRPNRLYHPRRPEQAAFMDDGDDYEMNAIPVQPKFRQAVDAPEEGPVASIQGHTKLLQAGGCCYIQTAVRRTQASPPGNRFELLKIDSANNFTLEKVFLPNPFRSCCQLGSRLLLISDAGVVTVVDGCSGLVERELTHPTPSGQASEPTEAPTDAIQAVLTGHLPQMRLLPLGPEYRAIYSDGDTIFTLMQFSPHTAFPMPPHMIPQQTFDSRLVLSLLTLGKNGLQCLSSIPLTHIGPGPRILGSTSIRHIRHILLTDSNGSDLYVICTEHRSLRVVKVFRMSDREVASLLADKERLLTDDNNPADSLVLAGKELSKVFHIKFRVN